MSRSVPQQILAVSLCATLFLSGCANNSVTAPTTTGGGSVTSAQVIKHVVVIFDENESFDHYFGTYPNAANPSNETVPFAASPTAPETKFTAAAGTPIPNNYISNPTLLTANANCYTGGVYVSSGCNNTNTTTGNGTGATNPFRMSPSQAVTSTESHSYAPEQIAFNNGAMDLFPLGVGSPDSSTYVNSGTLPIERTNGLTMSYFDGNTVTALWNYAQNYSLNDHFFGAQFGPSTIGAINLISGQTNGAVNMTSSAMADVISDGGNPSGYTLYQDLNPLYDMCSTSGPEASSSEAQMSGPNIGTLLTSANVTWGWFQGGFNLNATNTGTNTTGCARTTATITSLALAAQPDYIPRHNPFAFYTATSNPNHTRPTPTAAIGSNADAANHNYDTADFFTALAGGSMPAVSFLKPPSIQDSHADNSDPLDEQYWLATTINAIQQSQFWSSTAIIIAYDDSDGWYDHVYNVMNGSNSSVDKTICTAASPSLALPGVNATTTPHAYGRCGHGPRLPFLVISPWANKNYIDSTPIDQTSILRFIEDTFLNGQRLGSGSYDSMSGNIVNMFNFSNSTPQNSSVVLICPYSGAVTTSLSSCGY